MQILFLLLVFFQLLFQLVEPNSFDARAKKCKQETVLLFKYCKRKPDICEFAKIDLWENYSQCLTLGGLAQRGKSKNAKREQRCILISGQPT